MVSRKALKKDLWGWDGQVRPKDKPEPIESKRAPGKKDTRRWCKGKVGREHQWVTDFYHAGWKGTTCREVGWHTWRGERQTRWACVHAIRCSVCGKYKKIFLSREECPTYASAHHGES